MYEFWGGTVQCITLTGAYHGPDMTLWTVSRLTLKATCMLGILSSPFCRTRD